MVSNNGKGTPIITFRVGSGKLAEALTARDYKHESHRSEIAKRDLTRYYALLERSLATVQLTEAEANALCDANNMSGFDEALPASMLWANVLDTPGLDAKWDIETDLLVSKLRSLSPLQSAAVIDAIERFWIHAEDSTVQSVGLLNGGASSSGSANKMSDYSAALDLLPSLRPTDPDDGCEGMVGLVGEVSSEEARDLEKRVAALGYKSSATYVDEEDGIRTWWLWVL